MEQNKQQIKSHLQRISDILLINGGFLEIPGLYTGEMGIVLFFANYYFFTQNELYLDYSIGLIEKLQNRIHQETPINYKHGFAEDYCRNVIYLLRIHIKDTKDLIFHFNFNQYQFLAKELKSVNEDYV